MKKEFRWFSIWDYKKEEEYLRKMHRNGWKLVKVTGFGTYYFEECAPEDVIYRLDYNQEKKEEYLQLFADCGWEYFFQYGGYCYFRKSAAEGVENEEIFNDEASRLAMLERVYKGRLTPLLVIFSACIMPQFVINLTAGRYIVAAILGGVLAAYVAVFVIFGIKYHRFKASE